MTKRKSTQTAEKPAEQDPGYEVVATDAKIDADEALTFVRDHVHVADADGISAATKMIAQVKDQQGEIVAKWDGFKHPLKNALNEIKIAITRMDDFFGPSVRNYQEVERILKDKIITCKNTMEVARAALQDAAAVAGRAGNALEAERLMGEADKLEHVKVAGLSLPTTWKGEVSDPTLIPREYMIPDIKTLETKTRSLKADPKIPGWKAYPVTSATVTPSKVEQ
jgi:hypothetical protein